jgi:predicted RNA-binding Zn-ribbon protein involved in translation (DUF1610 family)
VAEGSVVLPPVYRERHMTIYQPSSSYSASIPRPPCPKCGEMMLLSRIEPDVPDHDRRTFECPNCGNSKTEVVKFK